MWKGAGWGGRLFEAGRLLTFSALRMGAYSRWALIRGWALEEASRELKISNGFLKLAKCWHQCIMLAEWPKTHNWGRWTITNDNKIMYKFNDKGIARYRYKQKQTPWNLWATLVCSSQSPNLVRNSSYFPQVGLCERPPDRMFRSGEALNLYAKFSKILFLSVSFLSSISEI